jgi:hypothetical protein
VDGHRGHLAPGHERGHRLDLDGVGDQPVGRLPEQDLARPGGPLQPGGHVDGVAGDERLPVMLPTGQHQAGVHPDAHRQGHLQLPLQVPVEVGHCVAQLGCGPDGAQGVVADKSAPAAD